MDEMDLNNSLLYADSARGVYIPQHFAESVVRDKVTGVTAEQWGILEEGPEHAFYWEVWDEVTQSARLTDSAGVVFTLYQDGDLWLVPEESGE